MFEKWDNMTAEEKEMCAVELKRVTDKWGLELEEYHQAVYEQIRDDKYDQLSIALCDLATVIVETLKEEIERARKLFRRSK